MFLGLWVVFPSLEEWFVSSPFQSIFSVYWGLASMKKTVDHCNISVDELKCKLVLVFHCKHDEERESEKERQKEKETKRETKTEREKERKASKEIRNEAEVEHTSFFVADRIRISGV